MPFFNALSFVLAQQLAANAEGITDPARQTFYGVLGGVPRNVAALVERPVDAAPTRLNVWTPAELHTFLAHAPDDRLAAMWRTFAMTGLRRGEACGLQWRHAYLGQARPEQVQKHRLELLRRKPPVQCAIHRNADIAGLF